MTQKNRSDKIYHPPERFLAVFVFSLALLQNAEERGLLREGLPSGEKLGGTADQHYSSRRCFVYSYFESRKVSTTKYL